MTRRRYRKAKNYKIVNVATKNVGSSGSQIRIGEIKKVDAQGASGYLHGIKMSAMLQEAEQDTASIMFYVTTDDVWDDNRVVVASATGSTGGSAWLPVKRYIRTNATPDSANDVAMGNTGPLYLWVEAGDYVASESIRYVAETWGRFITYTEI